MEFSKYEATANDFILLDRASGEDDICSIRVGELCDRHRGIGADGVILLLPSDSADMRMRIYNADGSEAQMCGNGVRALYLFALDCGMVAADEISIETGAGIKTVRRVRDTDGGDLFTVSMGAPAWRREEIPMDGEGEAVGVRLETGESETLAATCVSMGNPHCVVFVDEVASYPVERVGPLVENLSIFPERTNVEFVRVGGPGELEVRVWERGVGETMACGTGACASLVAAHLNGLTGKQARVWLPGGALTVEWAEDGVRLTGPARHVYDGKTVT
jgi:diaminopimelate epimerase